VLMTARRAMESITLDRGEMHMKDDFSPRYAEMVYNGLWFSPERYALQAAVDATQNFVTGVVRVKLYKVRPARGSGLVGPVAGGRARRAARAWLPEQGCRTAAGRQNRRLPAAPACRAMSPALCTSSVRQPAWLTRAAAAQGNVIVVGRKSPYSLYDEKIASFEDDGGLYDQKDAEGFIKLQARQGACTCRPARCCVQSRCFSILSMACSCVRLRRCCAYKE